MCISSFDPHHSRNCSYVKDFHKDSMRNVQVPSIMPGTYHMPDKCCLLLLLTLKLVGNVAHFLSHFKALQRMENLEFS